MTKLVRLVDVRKNKNSIICTVQTKLKIFMSINLLKNEFNFKEVIYFREIFNIGACQLQNNSNGSSI